MAHMQVSEFLGSSAQTMLDTVGEALRLQYEDYSFKRSNIIDPITEVADYVYNARRSGLDKRQQCSYAGSILVFSTLQEIDRKHASDVDKANKVYLAGMKLANTMWNSLDILERSSKKIDRSAFDEIVRQLAEAVWLHTIAK